MIAALYARKSTEQRVTDDAKSVTRQVELARDFTTSKGWQVAEEHVYRDDGISGAEFKDRPGLASLLLAVKSSPRPFDVVVAMDESRLGRDQFQTAYVLHQIADAGVQLWYYQEARQAKLADATGKFLESVRGFASEMEREKARARTREAMRSKAKAGHVAGGKVYGYANVREGSHVKRVVIEQEAEVVRRIFTMATEGQGLLRIAKTLNAEGIPSPKRDGWASTSVREMLRRDLYRGRIVYGKTRWQDKGGTKVKVDTPETDWLTLDAPVLRIIPEDLWRAAHARLERTRRVYTGHRRASGELQGHPEAGLVSRHLLSGHLRCGVCGGNMFVAPRSGKRGKPRLYYVCTTHHKRGNTRCTNRYGVPYEAITEAILGHFKYDFLNPVMLGNLLMAEWERQRTEPDELRAQRETLQREVKRLDQELGRLTEAVTLGGEVRALVDTMKAKQRQRDDAAARLEHLDGLEQAGEGFDEVEWFYQTKAILTDLQFMLESDPVAGRHIIRWLLPEPITVTPVQTHEGVVWEYVGRGALDRLLTGKIPGNVETPRPALPPGFIPWGNERSVSNRDTTELVPPG